MSLATDSSGFAAPHHGHLWVVIIFNLLPFFGGQFAPLFHDTMAANLKAYSSNLLNIPNVGPKHLAQGLPLRMDEGFRDLDDTVEAVREMREAEGGGVAATTAEMAELEAALGGQ